MNIDFWGLESIVIIITFHKLHSFYKEVANVYFLEHESKFRTPNWEFESSATKGLHYVKFSFAIFLQKSSVWKIKNFKQNN